MRAVLEEIGYQDELAAVIPPRQKRI